MEMDMTHTATLMVLALPVLLMLPGCASSIDDYRHEKPALELDQFFNGRLVAYGMVQNFSGKVTRRFRADINARWQDGTGTLDEQFEFNDGESLSEWEKKLNLKKLDKDFEKSFTNVVLPTCLAPLSIKGFLLILFFQVSN